jgi:acyl-CoA thioesterase
VDEPVRTVPGAPVRSPRHRAWLRADGKLPDNPLLHACVIAYASDLTLLTRDHGGTHGGDRVPSRPSIRPRLMYAAVYA